ncbi:MAG: hypothetical protein ACXWDN_06185, partial [Limisphaerales bacterium]
KVIFTKKLSRPPERPARTKGKLLSMIERYIRSAPTQSRWSLAPTPFPTSPASPDSQLSVANGVPNFAFLPFGIHGKTWNQRKQFTGGRGVTGVDPIEDVG